MTDKRPKLTYLAGPYTHPNQQVMEDREIQHSRCAAKLIKQNIHVYAPIAETCMIAKHDDIKDTGWEFWRAKDLNQLSRCDEMYIILMDGWRESKGVRGEVKFAIQNNIPIHLVDVDGTYTIEPPTKQLLGMFGVKEVTELND